MVLSPGESVRRFTLVVSQFEKTGTINFSVRAYSTLPFSLEKIKNPWRHKEEVTIHQSINQSINQESIKPLIRLLANGKGCKLADVQTTERHGQTIPDTN